MKNLSKKTLPIFLMLVFVLLFSQGLMAQPPGPPPPPPPPPVPISGLIALGLAVGAFFGVRRLRK